MFPLSAWLSDTARALRFFSRLPIPPLPGEADPHAAPDLARLTRAVPLAGAVIGAAGGLVLLVGAALGLHGLLLAALAVTALVAATGAFHEDGLADAADGLGGGRTREERLAIMKDSRIGAFGAAALTLSLVLRIAAVAALLPLGTAAAAGAVVAAGALSRTAALWLSASLPPARPDGAAAAAGAPDLATLRRAGLLAAALALVLVAPGFGLPAALAALAGSALAAVGMAALARRALGGHTGDTIGAAQQLAEIAVLLAVAMFAGSVRA